MFVAVYLKLRESGKEILRCWPTVLWSCEDGRISNGYSWLIPARQWRLDVHNLFIYYIICVKYIKLCVYQLIVLLLLLDVDILHSFVMKMVYINFD